jgi:hypothetical protein
MFMHTEKELSAEYGWSIADLRDVRALHCKFDNRELWFRKPSKKPEHLRTIIWTDLGVEFLQQWFKGLKEADKILAYLGNDPEGSGRLEELAVTNTIQDLYGLEWEGKVVSNWYPNSRLIEVEHENGIKVIAICRDNKKYRVKDKVLVDSKQASHYVRGLPLKK